MSLVYQKFFAISLSTVAAFISILWLKNRRKGRRLLADSSAPDDLNNIENNNKKADRIDCVYIEDTLTSEAVVSKVVSSVVSEQCDQNIIQNSPFFPKRSEVIEILNRPINQSAVEGLLGSKVFSHISKEGENYRSSTVELEEISAELDSVVKSSDVSDLSETSTEVSDSTETPAEISDSSESPAEIVDSAITSAEEVLDSSEVPSLVLDFIEPPVQLVKDSGVSCSIITTEKIEMKKETEQMAEPIDNLDLDKMKETGQLADKLASLELDQMKIDERKSGSERDSANHSPSEVMLASPSISNFSDAHSEGSSDSGKGQSDVAISPSRTPAGGSSLAGDQAPSVYEFVLPQIIVGRLIGRHGVFLNEIKTQTHTNIFIKRHPDSNKLKVCAIEGTQQDIDKALAKIRQKFPLRRFPQLTLEKVSFVQLNPLPPLKPEDFHLQLVEGVNNDVVLSSLVTAAHFFLQQPCHPSYSSLVALNSIMTQIYSSGEAPPLETPVNYAVCAAPAMEGWYRAQIIQVEEDGLHCTVKYLDYGGYSRVAATDLRQIRGDLLALPFQAVECYLANVAPAGEDWTLEAKLFVQSLTCGQILHAQVYDYAEDGAPLVYLYSSYGNQVVLINEQLVVNGFGVIAEQGSCCGTTDEEATKSERDTE